MFPNNRFSKSYMKREQWDEKDPYPVDWVSSAAMLVRRQVIDEVGPLDEDYFYWVDADWCHRIRKGGWSIYCLPASIVVHDEGKGSGHKDKKTLRENIIDFHRGAFLYYTRHHALGPLKVMKAVAAVGLCLRAAVLLVRNELRWETKAPILEPRATSPYSSESGAK
jgi:GT2 family glycosyltransferase